ncbi:hypothetical protein ACBP97_03420 [Niallia circulans]
MRAYQPISGFISQTLALISQTWNLSAKLQLLSAKPGIYQPNFSSYQPKYKKLMIAFKLSTSIIQKRKKTGLMLQSKSCFLSLYN